MTFDKWFEEFCRSQGGGYHWQVELAQMKESFQKTYEAGYEEGHCKGYQEGLKDDPF